MHGNDTALRKVGGKEKDAIKDPRYQGPQLKSKFSFPKLDSGDMGVHYVNL